MVKKKTGSSRYYFLFIFTIALIIAGYSGFRSVITKISLFEIDVIKITGNINLETEFLYNLSKDFIGQNLYAISKKDVLHKYENIVRIQDIKVTRIMPNKLRIKIIEKQGIFYIKTIEGELFPIDKNRIVLDNDNFYSDEILPTIETRIPASELTFGKKIKNEFVERVFDLHNTIISEDPDFINHISEFYEFDKDIYMIEANTGYRIVFGNNEIEDKLKKFTFLEQNRTFEKDTIVDLRFNNQLVIRSEVR